MKSKDFFKKLNTELDGITPGLSEQLKNMPINASEENKEEVPSSPEGNLKQPFFKNFNWQKVTAFATVILLSVIVVFGAINISMISKKPTKSGKMIVTMDVNPSISLAVDENNKVLNVASNNQDGDIVLCDDGFTELLIGRDLEKSLSLLAKKEVALGYLDSANNGTPQDYNKITITYSSNEKVSDSFKDEISSSLTSVLKESGVYAYVDFVESKIENFNDKFESIKNSAYLYYKSILDNIESLKEYAKNMVFKYCDDSLTNALKKYDIYNELWYINEDIKNDSDNKKGDNYWKIADDEEYLSDKEVLSGNVEKMAKLLEKLYNVYGVDLRSTGILLSVKNETELNFYFTTLKGVNIEGLRELNEKGIDEEFFKITSSYKVDYIRFVSDNFIKGIIDGADQFLTSTAEDFVNSITTMFKSFGSIKEAITSNNDKQPITNEDYDEFLKRIGK